MTDILSIYKRFPWDALDIHYRDAMLPEEPSVVVGILLTSRSILHQQYTTFSKLARIHQCQAVTSDGTQILRCMICPATTGHC